MPQIKCWKTILRSNITNKEELAHYLCLTEDQKKKIITSKFTLNLPLRLAAKIQKSSIDDPLFRQFVPLDDELIDANNFISDPVGDNLCKLTPKLLHKYQGRVLLVCTSACAMHCRFCFRQNYDYLVSEKSFIRELELIASDSTISEVILSGGDPLSLPDRVLKELLDGISQIHHIKRIRFHTRFPIGIPERINADFLGILSKVPQQIWFVAHCNHVRELDQDVLFSLNSLKKLGVNLLSQTVLLKDVNDTIDDLKQLFEKLVDNGIMPYYLHQLDRVKGTTHFEVEEEKGKRLIQGLAKVLPGYAVPKYVREISGEPNKTPL